VPVVPRVVPLTLTETFNVLFASLLISISARRPDEFFTAWTATLLEFVVVANMTSPGPVKSWTICAP